MKGINKMELNEAQLKYIETCPSFDDDMIERLQDANFQKGWLELTLSEFLEDGDVNAFIRCLTYVLKARVKANGRGTISKLAKELNLDRSNLSEIVNGTKQPKLETAFKLLNGLGYKYDIKLQESA